MWLDYCDPSEAELATIAREFQLHPLAVEDAVSAHQRPKLDRYDTHLFLNAYAVELDTRDRGARAARSARSSRRGALVTVRMEQGFDIETLSSPLGRRPVSSPHTGCRLPALRPARQRRRRPLRGRAGSSTSEIEALEDLLFDDAHARSGGAATQLRAAQEPGPAAPGRAADARGGERLMRRDLQIVDDGDDAVLPGRRTTTCCARPSGPSRCATW